YALVGSVQSVCRTDVDDTALFALCDHLFDAGLRGQEHACQVDVEGGVPILERIIFEGAGGDSLRGSIGIELWIERGTVDENVEAAELLDGFSDQFTGRFEARHIQGEG